MIRAWRWLRAFLSKQATLALLVVDLEARTDRLVSALRQEKARHDAELAAARASNTALRREAEAVDAANQAVIAQNRRERLFGNQLAHRNRLGHDWARQHLPPEQAAELCALLSPTLPNPKETTHA
ncbi:MULTISPECIES: hypothetical protein [unclassified Micromonospora]|uniref:hypothetical protein n=1 Tax=unclassified Micromonospora TaxID=2617518 RepID=UPI0033248E2C